MSEPSRLSELLDAYRDALVKLHVAMVLPSVTKERLTTLESEAVAARAAVEAHVAELSAERDSLLRTNEWLPNIQDRDALLRHTASLREQVTHYKQEVAELSAERHRLTRELDLYKDDAKECEKHCWGCGNLEISGDPERHEHEPQGGHWHHYIDPGDGLPSPCKNSDMLERIFKEQSAKVAELEARLAVQAVATMDHSCRQCKGAGSVWAKNIKVLTPCPSCGGTGRWP